MMKLLFFILTMTSITAQARNLNCEAWSQKLNQNLMTKSMEFKGIHPVTNEEMYRAELDGFHFKIDWSKQLDTLYASVIFNVKAHIFGTIRVPDLKIHNDAFLDFTNDNGDRVSISCNLSE